MRGRRRAVILVVALMAVTAIPMLTMRDDEQTPAPEAWTSGARRALDMVTNVRAYPNTQLPETGFVQAFSYARTSLQKTGGSTETWRALGPTNIGGRTLALAFNPENPNTLYAGSASGGLWRSYTAGVGENAWEYVSTGFPVLGVAAIAIAPDDSNTIYIGTGEVYGSPETFPGIGIRTTRGSYGIGLLKSSDGGQTWTKSLDWTLDQRRGVQKVRINPLRPQTVWAATTEGIYRSYNAGATWERIHDVPMGTDIKINPTDTTVVFAAHGGMGSPGHGLYRTQDGGATWLKMDLGLDGPTQFFGKAMLAMAPSNPNIVMAGIGNSNGLSNLTESLTWLVKTTDGGDSWSVVSTRDYSIIQGWYSHAVAIHPADPDTVWTAGMRFSPLRSSNGGANLEFVEELGLFEPTVPGNTLAYPFLHWWADYHDIVFHPTDPNTIYFANDGGVFRTTDGGRTSENCNSGYQVTQFYNGFSNSTTDSLLAVGGMQDNGSALYEGTPDWKRVGGGDGGWTAIRNGDLYLSAQFLRLFIQPDRGDGGFIDITPPLRSAPSFIAPFVVSPVNRNTIYAASTLVHRSTNNGSLWQNMNGGQPLDGNPVISMAVSFQNVNLVYAATAPLNTRAGVFRTDDGGIRWSTITQTLPDRFPTDLAVDPRDDRTVYVVFGGFGTGHVFKSTDAGGTWTDAGAGLPDVPTWAVIVDPFASEHVFIGNDLGVFESTDGGATWAQTATGLPDAVMAFDLSVSRVNRKLRMATHGSGVYERPLGSVPTPTEDEPTTFSVALQANYPNPFRTQTVIPYSLAARADVRLAVYDVAGRRVATLVEAQQGSGQHQVVFDAGGLASGTYIARLEAGGAIHTRTMLIVR